MKGKADFEPFSYYHIVNHAVGNENLFRTAENYSYFLNRYSFYMSSVCKTLAYCLMPNHVHFLIRVQDEQHLIKHPKFKGDFHKLVMQQLSNLLNAYAKAYNKRYERRGALWIDFTKRFKIEEENYLIAAINYIHQNPVHHRFCTSAEDWEYSSFRSHISERYSLLSRNEVLELFGSKKKYIDYHENYTNTIIEDWE